MRGVPSQPLPPRVCERPGCDRVYAPRSNGQRYCREECALTMRGGLNAGATTRRPLELAYHDPARVRADIRAVLDDATFWLTAAYDVAIHCERLLDQAEAAAIRSAA